MDERKEPLSLNNRTDTRSCPSCNFPVRSNDKICMFCHTPLQATGREGVYHYFLRYFQQLRWRWRLKKRRKSSKSIQYFKYFTFLGLGFVLTMVGGYLFFVSMFSNDFSDWLISLFFLFYGIYTLRTLLFRRKKQVPPLSKT